AASRRRARRGAPCSPPERATGTGDPPTALRAARARSRAARARAPTAGARAGPSKPQLVAAIIEVVRRALRARVAAGDEARDGCVTEIEPDVVALREPARVGQVLGPPGEALHQEEVFRPESIDDQVGALEDPP